MAGRGHAGAYLPAHGQFNRQPGFAGPAPHGRSVLVAEKAAPHAAHGQGNHRHRGLPDDAFDAGAESIDAAGAGEVSLGEEAHQSAVVQDLGDLVEGVAQGYRIFAARCDGNRFAQAQDPVHQGVPVDGRMHDEMHRTPAGAGDDQPVHIGDMVAHQHGAAFFGDIVQSAIPYAIDDARQEPHGRSQQGLDYRGLRSAIFCAFGESLTGEDAVTRAHAACAQMACEKMACA